MKLNPLAHQRSIINDILAHPRCAVFAGMGMGKTASVLSAVQTLKLAGRVRAPALVLAPLRVAVKTWPDERKKWDRFERMVMQPIIGSPRERMEALRSPADIYTINYENIPWLVEQCRHDGEWPFKIVIPDESTRLKGFRSRQGTKRARALASVAHSQVERWINLTGTPSPNGLKDLWGQTWFIDGGQRLGRTFSAFEQRWFRRSFNGFDIEPLPHAEREIHDLLRDICFSYRPEDYFELKEPVENEIPVELPPAARRAYKSMEKEMWAELEDKEVFAVNAAAKTQKCLQIAAGAVYTDRDRKGWEEVHKAKLEALEEVIEEAAGTPVLVVYHFKHDLSRLLKHFPRGQALDKNPRTQDAWNAGHIPILFVHPASCGHGLNLQDGGNIIAYFSMNWDLEKHQQVLERIGAVRQAQSGYDRQVFIHYIMAEGTVDYLVRRRLATKKSVQDILLEEMRRRKV